MRAHTPRHVPPFASLVLTHHATFLPLPHTRACTPRYFFHGPLADACSHTTPLLLFAALTHRFPRHLRSLTATRMAKSTTMSSRFVKPPHQPPSSYESDPLHPPHPSPYIHPSICSHRCTRRHSYDHDALKTRVHSHTHRSHRHITCIQFTHTSLRVMLCVFGAGGDARSWIRCEQNGLPSDSA
jgi:hypothetical protein